MDSRLITLLFTCVLAGSPAQAAWRDVLLQAQPVGQGSMSWFGLKLYRAELFSVDGHIDAQKPFALVLTYSRSFKAERIVDASLEQMRKLGISDANFPRWADYMRHGFVDVKEGDSITGVFLPGQGVRFYAGDKLTAAIDDLEFARSFFAIWLDPKTSEPTLRRQLLGVSP